MHILRIKYRMFIRGYFKWNWLFKFCSGFVKVILRTNLCSRLFQDLFNNMCRNLKKCIAQSSHINHIILAVLFRIASLLIGVTYECQSRDWSNIVKKHSFIQLKTSKYSDSNRICREISLSKVCFVLRILLHTYPYISPTYPSDFYQ